MLGTWKILDEKPQAMSETSPKQRSCGLYIGSGLPKLIGVHINISCAQDTTHQSIEFNICPARFQSSFDKILPWYSPLSSFWNGNVYSVIVSWEEVNFFFILPGLTA
jgi:hypothetical protein